MAVIAKPAATIMLTRDNKGTLEVLLLKRNKALAFAGGLWVFPGGKIEADELEQTATKLDAAKIAAVRETKEEANIDIDTSNLIFTRHWTTPEVEPRRYATWFFFASVPPNVNEVKVDDSEIKAHQWINPQEALNQMKAGKLAMLPPTFLNLQLIRTCHSVAEARAKLAAIEPVFVLPVFSPAKGKITLLYDGDAGYTTANANAEGARHRLIMQPSKGLIEFQYQGCEEYLPVNGGDDFFG